MTVDGSMVGSMLRFLKMRYDDGLQHDESLMIPEAYKSLFADLEQRYIEIKSSDSHQEIIAKIPPRPCSRRDNLYLEDQFTYLVALFLFGMPLEYCPQFNRHLNFCPDCAAYLAQVLIGFAPAKEKV